MLQPPHRQKPTSRLLILIFSMLHSKYARWFLILLAVVIIGGGITAYVLRGSIVATGERGILKGQVTVGPLCPTEHKDTSCTDPVSANRGRVVIVYAATVFKKEVARTNLSPFGEYSIELPPGEYTIDTGYTGVDTSKDLPHQVTIEPGEITEFNFSIDTGVR